MDFDFTDEQKRWRQEVEDWLTKELSDEVLVANAGDEHQGSYRPEFVRSFAKRMGEKGWLAQDWPKQYGGGGRTMLEQALFNEVKAYYRAPSTALSTDMTAPALALFGSEEHKKRFLGPIGRGEMFLCVGYSEPNAGTDLAAVKTRAVEEGDEWVINGHKIFTSSAQSADYIWLLARTDPDAPKHKGLSLFLVDMRSPGVTVRNVRTMAGWNHAEVFFDNVRAPKDALVGEKNRGWYQIAMALDFERSAAGSIGALERSLDDLLRYCKEATRDGRPLSKHPYVRRRLAELAVDVEAARLLSYRVAWLQSQHQVPNYEASMCKLFSTELSRRLAGVGMEILGLGGVLKQGVAGAPLQGRLQADYVNSVPLTIGAGSNEIQRNIIAQRGLGMPRV
jgi:alkylation response protein AidB-like acyl-CoA dehydrogenase